jgi:iron complex transport system substrate-binding protein
VNRRIRSGEPLYRIDNDLIRQLVPDFVITQTHCEVCAVTPADVERDCHPMPCPRMLSLQAGCLDGIFRDMLEIAKAIGRESAGEFLVCREQQRLANVRARTAAARRPSLIVLEWTDPMFAMGNWGPELIDIANGDLLVGAAGQYSCTIPAERVREVDPEYIIVAPCGFNLDRALRERAVLEAIPWWKTLRAVRTGNVAFADGNLFFNRSGMTISQTAEIIAEILHGTIFEAPSEGICWSRQPQ